MLPHLPVTSYVHDFRCFRAWQDYDVQNLDTLIHFNNWLRMNYNPRTEQVMIAGASFKFNMYINYYNGDGPDENKGLEQDFRVPVHFSVQDCSDAANVKFGFYRNLPDGQRDWTPTSMSFAVRANETQWSFGSEILPGTMTPSNEACMPTHIREYLTASEKIDHFLNNVDYDLSRFKMNIGLQEWFVSQIWMLRTDHEGFAIERNFTINVVRCNGVSVTASSDPLHLLYQQNASHPQLINMADVFRFSYQDTRLEPHCRPQFVNQSMLK